MHKVTPVLLRPLFDFCSKNTPVLAAISRVALSQIACEIEFSVLGQKSLSAFAGFLWDIGTPLGSLVMASGEHKIRSKSSQSLVEKLPKFPTFQCDISTATLSQSVKLSDQERIRTYRAL